MHIPMIIYDIYIHIYVYINTHIFWSQPAFVLNPDGAWFLTQKEKNISIGAKSLFLKGFLANRKAFLPKKTQYLLQPHTSKFKLEKRENSIPEIVLEAATLKVPKQSLKLRNKQSQNIPRNYDIRTGLPHRRDSVLQFFFSQVSFLIVFGFRECCWFKLRYDYDYSWVVHTYVCVCM